MNIRSEAIANVNGAGIAIIAEGADGILIRIMIPAEHVEGVTDNMLAENARAIAIHSALKPSIKAKLKRNGKK